MEATNSKENRVLYREKLFYLEERSLVEKSGSYI